MKAIHRNAMAMAVAVVASAAVGASAAVPYGAVGSSYTENFDVLSSTSVAAPGYGFQNGAATSNNTVKNNAAGSAGIAGFYIFTSGIAGATPDFNATPAGPRNFAGPDGIAPSNWAAPNTYFTTGNTGSRVYSFGAVTGDPATGDRALGTLSGSSSPFPGDAYLALVLQNTSSQAIEHFTLNYAGEKWRDAAAVFGNVQVNPQGYLFSYVVAPTFSGVNTDVVTIPSDANGTPVFNAAANNNGFGAFTRVPALDFTSSANGAGALGPVDGNAVANRTLISATVNVPVDAPWGPGQYLILRWFDNDENATDLGLGIDDLSFSGTATNLVWVGTPGAGAWDVNSTANWWNANIDPTPQADDVFRTARPVTMDDTAANFNVVVNSTVSPGAVTFNNSLHMYTISGTGGIAGGGALTKTGTGTVYLSTANSYTGGTNVQAGTLNATVAGALPSGTALSIGTSTSSATVNLSSGIGPVALSGLTINAGSTLDLSDNSLMIAYTGQSPVATIRAYLASGFNSGNWNGIGIASSAAHADANNLMALGYADTGSAIVVKYTYYGDSNLDGNVNTVDFQMFLDGLATGGGTWAQGDYTYDGKVDLGNDFNLFLIGFLGHGGSLGELGPIIASDGELSAAQKASLLSVVPEPGSAVVLVVSGLMAVLRRRGRRV